MEGLKGVAKRSLPKKTSSRTEKQGCAFPSVKLGACFLPWAFPSVGVAWRGVALVVW